MSGNAEVDDGGEDDAVREEGGNDDPSEEKEPTTDQLTKTKSPIVRFFGCDD